MRRQADQLRARRFGIDSRDGSPPACRNHVPTIRKRLYEGMR
jgi:hypothetical protein